MRPSTNPQRHGQSLVEFALILPFLLLLVFGIIELGRLMFIYSSVTVASREAARYGSAAGDIGGSIAHYQDCTGIRAAAKRVGDFAGIADNQITIQYDHGDPATPFDNCPVGGVGPGSVSLGDRVHIQVVAQYRPILPLANIQSFPISANTARTIVKDVAVESGNFGAGANDPIVTFALAKQTVTEATGVVAVVVQLSNSTTNAVTVNFSLSGTATNGTDYALTSSNPLVIPAGVTTAAITFSLNNDGLDETPETLVITMDSVLNAIKGNPNLHTVTIIDPPVVALTSTGQTVDEHDGSVQIGLSVTSDAPVSTAIDVPFSLTGSAAAGPSDDYTVSSNPVTIPAGTSTAFITLLLNDDSLDEDNETVIVTLAPPGNAVIGTPNEHTVTIRDNDSPPTAAYTWELQSVTEEVGQAFVTVELNQVSGRDVVIPFSASGTATLNSDYSLPVSSVTIPAGDLTVEIPVTILADSDDAEGDETIILTMGALTNATKGSPSVHTITISSATLTPPSVYFAHASTNKAESEDDVIYIEVRLSSAWSSDVIVPFTVVETATRGLDYTLTQSPVEISAGNSSAVIEARIINDLFDEENETVTITLETPENATLASPYEHIFTIVDDDEPPQAMFRLASQTAPEEADQVVVDVKLNVPSGKTITLPFSLNAISSTATIHEDFLPLPTTPFVIQAGETTASMTFNLIDDPRDEAAETIIIELNQPTNAVLGWPDIHTVWIDDNDMPICPDLHAMQISGNKLSMDVTHTKPGAEAVELTQIQLSWVSVNQNSTMNSISFGGALLWSGADPTSPTNIPIDYAWITGADRTLDTDQTKNLLFTMAKNFDTKALQLVIAYFSNGCTVSRTSGQQ